ncbi:MAG: peptidoglycan DD-metalloendopeptidase family protein [Methylococcales bacterium]|nr:peptidoglycan DD-metalloendopeptidase family protein [Methylococcales bacterium]MBT7408368.1 peptidoglycan DD-metalloendopeptidase family protein [Methylococcales bacterium]
MSILPLEYSRYDSTDLFKLNNFTILSKYFLLLIVVCSLSACNQVKYGAVFDRGYHLPKKISQKSQQKTVKKISKKVSQKKLPRYYVVKNGDTLYSIAWNFGKDVNELKKINKIDSKYTIFANQKILLMASRQQDKTIKHYKKAKPLSWIKKTKNIKPINTSKKTKSLWGWPVKKVQAHSIKRNNVSKKGVNIVGKLGQSIIASASGKVVYSGSGLIGYGKLIIIKHNRNYLSAYAYNKKLLVKEGEGVKKGQQIATMGYKYKKAVLHFEIRKNGKPVNPMNYLPKI